MIASFRHKGLRRLYETGDRRGVGAEHAARIMAIRTVLDAANAIEGLSLPTYRLHPLSGRLKGFWSVTVRANWRIIFRYENEQAHDVDLVDYH